MTPLSWLFCLIVWLRRLAYGLGLLSVKRLPVPVIVVGNISVGGTGKTPLVIWLARHLTELGYRPGIVSRGYGGRSSHWPLAVDPESDPREVGDEPVLIARRCHCPVWVGPDRPAAARALLQASDCDIILSDDGLQHYALGRDLEIAVVDGSRGLGNGFCLPAGPLREPASRLDSVDLLVSNGAIDDVQAHTMRLLPQGVVNLKRADSLTDPARFSDQPIHAVAGIGNPQRFFSTLGDLGLQLIEHPFDDHHPFVSGDLDFEPPAPVIMTEKDAVKCYPFAQENHWFLQIEAHLEEAFCDNLDQRLRAIEHG